MGEMIAETIAERVTTRMVSEQATCASCPRRHHVRAVILAELHRARQEDELAAAQKSLRWTMLVPRRKRGQPKT